MEFMVSISANPEVTAAAVKPGPPLGWVLASLSLCMLLPSLGTSVANVALPTLAQAFAASFQQVQWVVLAYLLATTALVVSVGRLGDLMGRRRLLMAGVLLFTAASGLCGVAPSLPWLIAARATQGVGAAVMMALTMAFVAEAVPKARTGSAMGLLGTMSAVGTALGPSLGGLLIATLGWQAIFLVNLPLGAVAFVLVRRYLPADRRVANAGRPRFDHPGTLLLVSTLVAYALAVTLGLGNFGPLNQVLLLATAVGGGLFIWAESRARSPLIRLERLRDPALSASLAANALVSTVMMSTLVVGPFYLARSLNLDTALVGLAMSAGPVVSALSGVPAGRGVDRWGQQRMTQVGLVGMAVGCAALCLVPAALGIAGYVAPLVIVTAHYALFQAANNTSVMTQVPPDQRGVVSGMLTLARNLGLVTGASVMGAVFAVASGAPDVSRASPESAASGMRVTFAVAAGLVIVALGLSLGGQALARRAARPRPC